MVPSLTSDNSKKQSEIIGLTVERNYCSPSAILRTLLLLPGSLIGSVGSESSHKCAVVSSNKFLFDNERLGSNQPIGHSVS